jgi:ADP-ribosylglycohydrolase
MNQKPEDCTVLNLDLTGPLFRDKVRGCWVGKNCGGTLGTPLEEGWGRPEPFDVWWYPELRDGGLPNDDLEMQLVWLTALEQVGTSITARDLARYWLDHIGYNFDEYGLSKTNLRLGLEPPVSGAYNNWFVDCMGSPIRSEIWACVAPGVPRVAARFAYEDAICDHAGGESVFGELFNVAVQSAAFVVDDPATLVEIGLSYVPETSMTAKAVRAAVQAHAEGLDWKQARERVLAATPHHVAQYSPLNLGFQVIGLLDGRDFGDAMCKTVNCGYDTDSSGGTIGSWWGIIAGADALPTRWTEPFGDAISTNESWGGVRHLSDGTTPIPGDLPTVVERMVAAAQRVLREKGHLDGGTLTVSRESLYADDSVRALWSRDPMRVEHPGNHLGVGVGYVAGPAVIPGTTARIDTRIDNPHPDPVVVHASLLVPAGWPAPPAQRIEVPPATSVSLDWKLDIPPAGHVENSNRLFLVLDAEGYPQEAATPIVLVGAAALRVSGPFHLDDGQDEGALLDHPFAPEASTAADTRPGPWRDVSALGNALPEEALPTEPGVTYVQTFFHAPEAMKVTLGVDSAVPAKAWLNGDEVLSMNRYRPIRPSYAGHGDGYGSIQLEQGWNELLVKLVRTEGAPRPECHVVLSTDDGLHHGLPRVGRTRLPWSR